MKKNYFSSKNPKMVVIALLLLLSGLFANEAVAQTAVANNDTFIWTGINSSNWNDAGNWTVLRGTTTAGTNNYPGEVSTIDVVYINKNDAPNAPILDAQIRNIVRLFVNNSFGSEAGATLTINSGATLNVGTGTASNFVVLAGGNIINNGTLNINATGVGFTGFPAYGINCSNPSVLPTVPTEYGYSGSGTLSINLSAANFANGAAIAVIGNSGATVTPTNNANATYKLVLNNPSITLNQASTATINVIRANGGNNANKLIIGGTGFTIGTVGTPSIGSLISLGGGSSVQVESGTTLTFNSASTYNTAVITGFSSSTFATNLTNKGTIHILGASARSGMGFSTGASATASVYNISNEGTLNVNLNAITGGQSALNIGNGGGGAANAGSAVNVNNTGTMTLKNTATAAGTGFAIFCVSASEAAPLFITNNGTLNLESSTYAFGLKTTINNNGTLNSNSELRSFVAVNNNLGGSINFVRTATTATTRQVTFTITTSTDISGAIGSIYKDANDNQYAIVIQKFSGGTALVANVIAGATIPTSGTLTRVSTGAGTASIAYTAVSIPALNNALAGTTTNSGTINTDTESNLNIISGVTTTADSVIAPGGATGYGIASFTGATKAILGTLTLQVVGNTAAGVDYDQITNLTTDGGFDITGAILDVTGISGTATPVDIILANGAGTIAGPFASVEGLTPGWSVDYSTAGKVQLINEPALGTPPFADAKFSYYPNPTRSQLNVSATKNISTVELFNILGQKVQSITVNANQKQLDISNLQNGVYLMEVTIDNRKESFKIMKQ